MNTWNFRKLRIDDKIVGGVERFAIDGRIHNFVRESVQNVRDQAMSEDQPVDVSFEFHDLTGSELAKFLDEIRWEHGLRQHLEACSVGNNHDLNRMRRNLELLAEGTMRVLVVRDRHTNGLSGDEYGRNGNFCKLCRNEMIPSEGEGEQGRGGSFGIGKSVFWAFSGIQTVLFSSIFRDDNEPEKLHSRVFGRTYLPDHPMKSDGFNGEFSGDGYLCKPDSENDGANKSMTMEEAGIVEGSFLHRDADDTGTTIVVLMFENPEEEETLTLEELSVQFQNAIVANFWPLIDSGLLNTSVATRSSSGQVSRKSVTVPSEFAPLLRALRHPQDLDLGASSGDLKLLEEGETAFFTVPMHLPQRIAEKAPHPAVVGRIATCVTRLTEEELDKLSDFQSRYTGLKFVNHLACIRGAQMVVLTRPGPANRVNNYVGVVRAGLFRPVERSLCDETDDKIERFLRDSEPAAHSSWDYGKKLKSAYKRGWKSVVTNSFEKVNDLVTQLLRPELKGERDRPDGLAELLQVRKEGTKEGNKGGSGGSGKRVEFRGTLKECSFDLPNRKVTYKVEIRRIGQKKSTKGPTPWSASVKLCAVGEVGELKLHLLSAEASDGLMPKPVGSAMEVSAYSVTVPDALDRFELTLVGSLSRFATTVAERIRIVDEVSGEDVK
jgi:hypothetical protein